jgi:Ca2+-binding RTX toxin-like protein
MAVLRMNASQDVNMDEFYFSDFYDGDDYVRRPNLFTVTFKDHTRSVFEGKGFTYDEDGVPISGTVTSYTQYLGSTFIGEFSDLKFAATKIADAGKTASQADDIKVLKQILSGNDDLAGSNKDDVLNAYAGKDHLFGRGGTDYLDGGTGNDVLRGGSGGDRLIGNDGADTFIFFSASESRNSAQDRDRLLDFDRGEHDRIGLSDIDANTSRAGNQTFTFIGTQEFHDKAGEVRYEQKSGDTLLTGDIDGDGKADFAIQIQGTIDLKAGDFLL